jgi:hypothetical protein
MIGELVKDLSNRTHGKASTYGLGCRCLLCKEAKSIAARQHYLRYSEKIKAYEREYNLKNKEKISIKNKRDRAANPNLSRIRHLKTNYNLTLDEYIKLLAVQDGVCFLCKKSCPTYKWLAVDHNHKTNKIRKLLCIKCNVGVSSLEWFREISILDSALTYIDTEGL